MTTRRRRAERRGTRGRKGTERWKHPHSLCDASSSVSSWTASSHTPPPPPSSFHNTRQKCWTRREVKQKQSDAVCGKQLEESVSAKFTVEYLGSALLNSDLKIVSAVTFCADNKTPTQRCYTPRQRGEAWFLISIKNNSIRSICCEGPCDNRVTGRVADLVSVITGSQEPSFSALFEDDSLNVSALPLSLVSDVGGSVPGSEARWLSPPPCQMAQGCAEISAALKTLDKVSACKKKKNISQAPPCGRAPAPLTAAAGLSLCCIQSQSIIWGFIERSHNALPLVQKGGDKSTSVFQSTPVRFIFLPTPLPNFVFAHGILKWLSPWLSLSCTLKSIRKEAWYRKPYISRAGWNNPTTSQVGVKPRPGGLLQRPVYGHKCTAYLSGYNKAVKNLPPTTRHAVGRWIKIHCAGNELSKFRVHIAWNYTKAGLQGSTGKNSIALSALLPEDSLSGFTLGPGEIVWATACICECNNSFVNDITSSHIFAYLAAVTMLSALYRSPCVCSGKPTHTLTEMSALQLAPITDWYTNGGDAHAHVCARDSRVTATEVARPRVAGIKRCPDRKWQGERCFKVFLKTASRVCATRRRFLHCPRHERTTSAVI